MCGLCVPDEGALLPKLRRAGSSQQLLQERTWQGRAKGDQPPPGQGAVIHVPPGQLLQQRHATGTGGERGGAMAILRAGPRLRI